MHRQNARRPNHQAITLLWLCLALSAGLSCIRANEGQTPPPARTSLEPNRVSIRINCAEKIGALENFWNASGVCCQDYHDPVMRQNMELIGSIPHQGCLYQRPHNLLSLIRVQDMNTDNPQYDWSRLDSFLDTIVSSGQRLFFELMGKPSDQFTSFGDPQQMRAWQRLVTDLATHLETRYGRAEVLTWYFETWNEPDINFGWKWTGDGEFCNYYDACSEGLRQADPALRFGGVGSSHYKAERLIELVRHCMEGTNALTGEKGVRLDFISYHNKRRPTEQVDASLEIMNLLIQRWPHLRDKLFINNESDSESGWERAGFPWRATPWYAAYIARQVNEHVTRIINPLGLKIRIANDNAFIGPWTHRTHFTWFGDGNRFALIKKPAHNIMTLLALLGDTQCGVQGVTLKDSVGVLATCRGADQVAILVYNFSNDTQATGVHPVHLMLDKLPFEQGRLVHYRIDEHHANPHRLWHQQGEPNIPSAKQLLALRQEQEIATLGEPADIRGPQYTLDFDLPLHSVSLIVISNDRGCPIAAPTNLRAHRDPGLIDGKEEITLRWDCPARAVKTFEVLYATRPQDPFVRVNPVDIISTAFVHQKTAGSGGVYQVRALDYWNRPSPASVRITAP